MTKFEQFLKDSMAYADARKAPREPLSAETEEMIKAALAEKFGKARILPVNAMRVVILNLLSKSTLTGLEIIDRLTELRLEMETKGDGSVLGLLHRMEADGVIGIRFQESTATRRYEISSAGSQLLIREENAVVNQYGLAALLNAQ
jgi:hypothetical protein